MNFSEVMWLMLIGLLSYVIEMTDANGPVIAEPYQQFDLGKLFQEIYVFYVFYVLFSWSVLVLLERLAFIVLSWSFLTL